MAEFLHTQLNPRVTAAEWAAAIVPAWTVDQPNHGFLLRVGEHVVGVYLAFYSQRKIDGRSEQFCNLAAWCVLEEYRSHGLRLLRALLAQKGYHFTDLSPSGSVVPLNTRLRFFPPRRSNRPRSQLCRGLSGPGMSASSASPMKSSGRYVAATWRFIATTLVRLRRAMSWSSKRGETCYVMFRKDRRKNLPLFASILYVGNPELFRDDCQVRLPASACSATEFL